MTKGDNLLDKIGLSSFVFWKGINDAVITYVYDPYSELISQATTGVVDEVSIYRECRPVL